MNTVFKSCLWFAVVLTLLATAHASDHADPVSLNPFADLGPGGPRITDLHVFEGKADLPKSLVVMLGVNGNMRPGPYMRLSLESFAYRVHMDLHAALRFEDPGDLARYGGTLTKPRDISPDVVLEFRLSDQSCSSAEGTSCTSSNKAIDEHRIVVEELRITGLPQSCGTVKREAPLDENVINLRSGVFDDSFVFPRFFRRNVVTVAFSIPFSCFPPGQQNWVMWGSTSMDDKQIDHVGRSQRTQLPRFDYLNTLAPRDHVDAINRAHEHPTLEQDLLRTFISPLYGRRPYDAVPDVLIWNRSRKTLFPNGRNLEDDVGGIIAPTGDTQLLEVSYTDDRSYPRATINDKPLKPDFPYVADPWTPEEVVARGDPFNHPARPAFAPETVSTLRWLAFAAIALLLSLLGLFAWIGFKIGQHKATVSSVVTKGA